ATSSTSTLLRSTPRNKRKQTKLRCPSKSASASVRRPTSSSPAPGRLAGGATCSRSDFERRFAQFLDAAPDVLLPRQMSAIFMSRHLGAGFSQEGEVPTLQRLRPIRPFSKAVQVLTLLSEPAERAEEEV